MAWFVLHSTYSPGQAVEFLEINCSGLKPSVRSRSNNTRAKYYWQDKQMGFCLYSLFGMILKRFDQITMSVHGSSNVLRRLNRNSSFVPGSHNHASRSVSQGNKKQPQTRETCGLKQSELFPKSDLDSYCSKMCPEFANTCESSSGTCAELAMKLNGPSYLERMTWGLCTEGKESGYWRTPQASDGDHGGPNARDKSGALHLSAQVMFASPTNSMITVQDQEQARFDSKHRPKYSDIFPTPTATPYGTNKSGPSGKIRPSLATMATGSFPTPRAVDAKNSRLTLVGVVRQFPTPTVQDAENAGSKSQQKRNTPPLNAVIGGKLNPEWVELLMGWPKNWSSLVPIARSEWEKWIELFTTRTVWGDTWENGTDRTTENKNQRVNRLKAIGNGQVPLTAALALSILYERIRDRLSLPLADKQ